MPATERLRLAVVPGLEILVSPGSESSAVIHVGEAGPAGDGTHAVEVSLSRRCLRTLLNGNNAVFAEVIERGGEADSVHIAISANELVQQIADDIGRSNRRGAGQALYLQGKVLELLAEGLAERQVDSTQGVAAGIRRILLEDPLNPPSLVDLARRVNLSVRRMNEIFRAAYGMTVFEWLLDWRLGRARELLLDDRMAIKDISLALGYGAVSNFINAFTKHFGVSPARMRARAFSPSGYLS